MAEKEIRVLEERETISIFIRRRSVASTGSAIKRKHRSQWGEDRLRLLSGYSTFNGTGQTRI